MNTTISTKWGAGVSPLAKARIAGVFYLLTFLTGTLALVVPGRVGVAAGLIAGACYIVVTLLLYGLFKPVNRSLYLIAASVSLVGIAVGPLQLKGVHPLVFFGVYCLLIGYLISRSTFLPRTLGALMAFASVGWLTFLSPALAESLYPYNLAPGIIGEGALTLWLLVVGVNVPRWLEQASAARGIQGNEMMVIRRSVEADLAAMLGIINDAARAYRGVIPGDRWHEPYMPADELAREIVEGVVFWVAVQEGRLAGVMGIQDKGDVALVRHAYVAPSTQRGGVGTELLRHVKGLVDKPILVGTWAAASWAIEFYRHNGFAVVPSGHKDRLLRTYWSIPARQIEASVVLANGRWIEAQPVRITASPLSEP